MCESYAIISVSIKIIQETIARARVYMSTLNFIITKNTFFTKTDDSNYQIPLDNDG